MKTHKKGAADSLCLIKPVIDLTIDSNRDEGSLLDVRDDSDEAG